MNENMRIKLQLLITVLVQHYQADNCLMSLGDVPVLNIPIMKHILTLWRKWTLSLIKLVQLCLQKFKATCVFLPSMAKMNVYLVGNNICNILFKLQIDCCIKLSGMPDLTLSFMNPRLFDDVSFHPCVRFKRWEVRMGRSN